MTDLQSVFWSVAIFTGLCGFMCLYAWLFESKRPIWSDDECELDYPQPGGSPQWRDE